MANRRDSKEPGPRIGVGPVDGTVIDRREGEEVERRTPAAYILKYARNYKLTGDRVILNRPQGTQYWHKRGTGPHPGEDIYVPAGTPTFAPFDATVYARYASYKFKGESATDRIDYGEIVELRSVDNPRLWARIVHLDDVVVNKGDRLSQGEQIGVSYSTRIFPGRDPSHLHVEAWTGDDKPVAERGNRTPYAAYNVALLTEPGNLIAGRVGKSLAFSIGTGLVVGLLAVGGYHLVKKGTE